uniref:Uncharacterized protein n=1 Tax=Anopheles atroparvus TaxID=41427 RepID=A0AAG5D4N5_ANOAO
MVGESANGGTASLSADSPSSSSLFNAPNGYSPSPSTTDYALPASYSGSGDSPPQHPLGAGTGGPAPDDGSGSEQRPASATPAPPSSQSAMLSATGEFSSGPKDTRMRKPKERKLQRAYGAGGAPGGGGGGGDGSEGASRTSSPNAGNGPSGNGPASTRIKSLDALTNLCWPEGEQFPTRMRKHSNANGSRAKDASNGRKENNEQDSPSSMASASPRGVVSSGRRTKKQSAGSKQSAKEAKAASEGKEKPTSNETIAPTPPVENKVL